MVNPFVSLIVGEGVTTVTWNNFWGKSRAVEQLERGGWGLRRGGGAADKLDRGSRGGGIEQPKHLLRL